MENVYETTEPGFRLSQFAQNLPRALFSHLEEGTGPLLPSHQRVAMVLESVRIETSVRQDRSHRGRPPYCLRSLARAFLAKAVLNIPTTKDLVERLALDARLRRVVGFGPAVPSESVFSRAFSLLAREGVLDLAHERAVRSLLGSEAVHHASTDASAIPVRERGGRKEPGGEKRRSKRDVSVQERRSKETARESAASLPRACGHGLKRGPKGYMQHWRGYKGHASVGDEGIPLAFLATSAGTHDSLAAIPLLRLTHERVAAVFYALMDKAYAGRHILAVAEELGQVLIVPPKAVKGEAAPEMEPHRARRYRHRTTAERFFADLKENHGGGFVFVRGGEKVHAHLMLGVLAIFGLRILRL